MAGKFNDIELLFIEEVLDQHGEYLFDLFQDTIDSKALKETENLADSIQFKVTQDSRGPKLSFTFPSYGRFIEINFHKRRQNSSIFGIERSNSQHLKKKKKKDTDWYTRNVYGSLNRLIGILMYELSDSERLRLKNLLENGFLSSNQKSFYAQSR